MWLNFLTLHVPLNYFSHNSWTHLLKPTVPKHVVDVLFFLPPTRLSPITTSTVQAQRYNWGSAQSFQTAIGKQAPQPITFQRVCAFSRLPPPARGPHLRAQVNPPPRLRLHHSSSDGRRRCTEAWFTRATCCCGCCARGPLRICPRAQRWGASCVYFLIF